MAAVTVVSTAAFICVPGAFRPLCTLLSLLLVATFVFDFGDACRCWVICAHARAAMVMLACG